MSACIATGVFSASSRDVELGFRPTAIIFWWTLQDGDGVAAGNSGGIGFWADGEAKAGAWASVDGVAPTSTVRCADDVAVLALRDERIALRGRIEPRARGFTLEVQGEANAVWSIHYLAFGGAASGRVGWLADRVDTGFRPDVVLVCPVAAGRPGVVERGLRAGFGAAAADGAQGGAAFMSQDASSAAEVGAAQERAAVVVIRSSETLEDVGRIDLGTGGFTVAWQHGGGEPAGHHPYLALSGVRCTVGIGLSPPSPRRRTTRGVSFRPEALLVCSWGLAPRTRPTDIGRLCVGAATKREVHCAGWDDRDVRAKTSATHSCSSKDHVLLVTNTQTGELHAAAKLGSFDRRGFTLDWDVSDGYEREFVFAAFTSASAPRRLAVRSR